MNVILKTAYKPNDSQSSSEVSKFLHHNFIVHYVVYECYDPVPDFLFAGWFLLWHWFLLCFPKFCPTVVQPVNQVDILLTCVLLCWTCLLSACQFPDCLQSFSCYYTPATCLHLFWTLFCLSSKLGLSWVLVFWFALHPGQCFVLGLAPLLCFFSVLVIISFLPAPSAYVSTSSSFCSSVFNDSGLCWGLGCLVFVAVSFSLLVGVIFCCPFVVLHYVLLICIKIPFCLSLLCSSFLLGTPFYRDLMFWGQDVIIMS